MICTFRGISHHSRLNPRAFPEDCLPTIRRHSWYCPGNRRTEHFPCVWWGLCTKIVQFTSATLPSLIRALVDAKLYKTHLGRHYINIRKIDIITNAWTNKNSFSTIWNKRHIWRKDGLCFSSDFMHYVPQHHDGGVSVGMLSLDTGRMETLKGMFFHALRVRLIGPTWRRGYPVLSLQGHQRFDR